MRAVFARIDLLGSGYSVRGTSTVPAEGHHDELLASGTYWSRPRHLLARMAVAEERPRVAREPAWSEPVRDRRQV
jgi:hypothetical protein